MALFLLLTAMAVATLVVLASLYRHLQIVDPRTTCRAAICFTLYAPAMVYCTHVGEDLGLNLMVADVMTALSIVTGLIAFSLWIDYFSRRH